MNPCLTAERVSFSYAPEVPALRDVDAEICSGDLTGIVGPNGSGKSTLLRVLCGLLRADAGTVRLNGRPLSGYSSRERARHVAFLPQEVQPAFSLTVFETVALGRYPHMSALAGLGIEDRRIVERCLRDTTTEEFRDREFTALSGGERQRVLLASVLAQEPRLLLLDEPTSSLDLPHQVEIFRLLERLAAEDYGVCVVTHDLNLAARFCTRLLLLSRDHRLHSAGSPREVFTSERLTDAYGAPIDVCDHPVTGAPLITAIEEARV